MTADGFDRNVAEKMPRMRKLEDPLPSPLEAEPQPLEEDHEEPTPQMASPERKTEGKVIVESPGEGQSPDVSKLIEDLHGQLLGSAQIKRALEMDLKSYEQTIHQLTQDNQELRYQLDVLSREQQKFQEFRSESVYLQEENADALERIREFQLELKEMKGALMKATQEREEAHARIRDLEFQVEQYEVLKIKGKLKEKEVAHFSEGNRELQSKLEEALSQNIDLERKYETLRKSFNEVKESLTLLRDSCKKTYYGLSDPPE
jgi:chromosome segregation ATPase